MRRALPRSLCISIASDKVAVRVVFSDESSANSGGSDTVVAAIMANLDSQWPQLPEQVEKLIEQQGIDPKHYELKGADLFRDIRRAIERPSERRDDFAKRAKILITGCLSVLYTHGIPVFCGVINKVGWEFLRQQTGLTEATPYALAFGSALRDANNFIHTSTKEPLLWVSDDAGSHRTSLEDALRTVRALEKVNWDEIAPGMEFPESPPVYIAETVCFADTKKSRALQLADVCASIIGNYINEQDYATPFFNVLRSQLKSSWAPLFLGTDNPHQTRRPRFW
jgi:hypothetical protein